jgi:hypothetical protein
MFERYTEKARRTIFHARHEAQQLGSSNIETEHLLLGLLHENTALTNHLSGPVASDESIRRQIEQHTPTREKVAASVDTPLTNESKRVLAYAAEEADRLAHRHIGTEHLLLGLLREEKSFGAKILTERGLGLKALREELRRSSHGEQPAEAISTPSHRETTAFVRVETAPNPALLLRSIRIWLVVVIAGLLLSGVTAFPLQTELAYFVRLSAHFNTPALNLWLVRVYNALADTNARYPFLAYGTDWLAFAHLVIAAAFIGPYLDPVRNKWVITWGLISCAAVPFLALIAGPIRGIPLYWRLIDCSFGIFCCIPLFIIRRLTTQLETQEPYSSTAQASRTL